jgi:hypothetical protein
VVVALEVEGVLIEELPELLHRLLVVVLPDVLEPLDDEELPMRSCLEISGFRSVMEGCFARRKL